MGKLFSDDIDGNSLPNIGQFNISFTPGGIMFPIARLLVFYVRNDGEIVADLGIFRIKKCSKTKVKFSIPQKQQYPSTEAKIMLSANPSSICGIDFVDKSVQLLHDDTEFSEENVRILSLFQDF
ncbi:murinoglobulin-2-like [Stegodyphus dumicola]|uniref:murinoglobulin-2-like n=1 Tax=Stegodyphus dumicola TaxID=202533 RepID=UPI0015AF3616|nr:murinoglobulin-2-like [Stegodyphus dumicola]